MTPRELLDQYLLENELSAGGAANMRRAVDSFDCYVHRELGHEPTTADLTSRITNLWIISLASQLAKGTISSYRGRLLTLWRYAHRLELVQEWPSRVRKVKVPRGQCDSWTDCEVAALIAEASKIRGNLSSPKAQGIPRAGFLVCAIAVMHAAGTRPGDIRRIGWNNLRGEQLSWIQHKTGKPISRPLPAWLVAMIHRTFPRTRELWFGGVISYNRMRLYFARISERAALVGTMRKMRRSSGNSVEEKHPGFGHRHLGNTAAVFEAYYADKSRLSSGVPSPQPIQPPRDESQGMLF